MMIVCVKLDFMLTSLKIKIAWKTKINKDKIKNKNKNSLTLKHFTKLL